jgi:hypothetical protein
MTTPMVFALLGLGLGALLIVGGRRSNPRASAMDLRERAIAAQVASARMSQLARDLTARALKGGN